jgi:poly(3-hydroxybutyrate) depolymerase
MRSLPLLVFLIACAPGFAADRLPALGVDPAETSVSGLSSGGFMAVQFHLAHSSIVHGIGVFAGGPWGCAQGSAERATGECTQGSPDPAPLVKAARKAASGGRIDPVAALARSRVWLFSGYNDGTVRRPTMNALRDFYAALVPAGQIFYRNDLRAGHALVTLDRGAACDLTGGDFVVDCDYDAVGALLQFIHGRLAAPGTPRDAGLRPFDQGEFAPGGTRSAALADTGYVYVPATCGEGQRCRTHVVLHGCRQTAESVGDAVYRYGGYNRWAETNRIVVLYPQARATWGAPLNPYGCWDWWGYTSADYTAKSAPQIAALRGMVDRLASGPVGAATAPPAPAGAVVVDASSSALALAWGPVAGAVNYEVEASGRRVDTMAPASSIAFAGLAPDSRQTLAWRARSSDGRVLAEARLEGVTAREPPDCDPWFASNVSHVRAGRAYALWGLVYARGTNQPMGWWNIFTTTQLHRVGSGFATGPCP